MKKPYSPLIAIIDLGAGNLRSVDKAIERAASLMGEDVDIRVTTNGDDIVAADRIVLPGVGAFNACMEGLLALDGMKPALEHAVLKEGKPILGICVGMQLFATQGLEYGQTKGLGWIPGQVRKIESHNPSIRVPNMGWMQISPEQDHGLFNTRNKLYNAEFYFLHSYHFDVETKHHSIAVCDYGFPLVCTVAKDNIVGVQFHPEKSQTAGLLLLQNFLRWTP